MMEEFLLSSLPFAHTRAHERELGEKGGREVLCKEISHEDVSHNEFSVA